MIIYSSSNSRMMNNSKKKPIDTTACVKGRFKTGHPYKTSRENNQNCHQTELHNFGITYDNEEDIDYRIKTTLSRLDIKPRNKEQNVGVKPDNDYTKDEQSLSIMQISKLFPDYFYPKDDEFRKQCDTCIELIMNNSEIGFESLSLLFRAKNSYIMQLYSQYSDSEKIDAIYHFASGFYEIAPYITMTLMTNIAFMKHEGALGYCTHKLNVNNIENTDLAIELLKQSTYNDDSEAMYKLSKLLQNYYPGNDDIVIILLERASHLKYTPAMHDLIEILISENKITENKNKIIKIAQIAAESECIWAMNLLGSIYAIDNTEKAIKWYERSAIKGDIDALICLGDIYYGDPTYHDADKAI